MLIDSHCHIPDKKYRLGVSQIIDEAKEAGVEKLISIGTSLQNSWEVLETAKKHDDVYAVVGVYPHEDLDKSLKEIKDGLREILNSNRTKIVGIGECGLDVPQGEVPYKTRDVEEQRELFKMQLGLAAQRDLPVVLHNRNADPEMLDVLELFRSVKLTGVAHCFSTDWETAKEFLHLNYYISFSGMVTYPSVSKALLEAVRNVPRDRLLVETDAPFLPPQGHRGEVNYPKYVTITAAKIADMRKTSPEEIAHYTYKNACRLFGI